jgi:predicted metal-dependent phosphoesterase TrpH
MRYRYETHCHSSRCSRCAHSTPAELVKAYSGKGFAGLVLTDHFVHGNNCVDPSLPWEKRMQCYYDAYLEAKEAAKDLDFDVLFGIEHAYGGGLEVLCYGIDLDFLLNNADIPQLDIQEFARRVHSYGGILIHAHPYRNGGQPTTPAALDGVEVLNANYHQDNRNDLALAFALENDLLQTSGSDCHSPMHVGNGGILVETLPENDAELVALLRSGNYKLIGK